MKEKISIDCVVVTYNRLNLLKECINALETQSYKIEHIFVVNNASTDGTSQFLYDEGNSSRVVPIQLKQNIGGAGGFNKGIRAFIENSRSDFVWVMDDDTIPNLNSLEELVEAANSLENVGFLTSNVRWKDGSPAVMNVPRVSKLWNENLNDGLVRIKSASFVSVMFSRNAVLKVGLPISEFFIWGDDVEFTLRIFQNHFDNYLVSKSYVTHKIAKNNSTNIFNETDVNRIKRYFYSNRNTLFCKKTREGTKEYIKEIIRQIYLLFKILFRNKHHTGLKLITSIRGLFAGLVFNPNIETF